MKEIFLVPITKTEYKKVAKTQRVTLGHDLKYRNSSYILFYDKKSGEANVLSRIISYMIPSEDRVIPQEVRLTLALSQPMIMPKSVFISTKNPPSFITFEELFRNMGKKEVIEFKTNYLSNEKGLLMTGYMEQALNYSTAQRLKEALENFNNCLDIEYDNYQLHFYTANIYMDFMEIVRAKYVWRHGDGVDRNYIYFGIENLPSLFYWLGR
jgi:tetratricopeptide (TPR) repeat protein